MDAHDVMEASEVTDAVRRTINGVADISRQTGGRPIGVAMLLVVLPTGKVTELIVGDVAIKRWEAKREMEALKKRRAKK